jgi:hypothetical protein
MSKKHRGPKPEADAAPAADLIEARVAVEREWCYAGWLTHKTPRQLAAESMRPAERGGLGYYLGVPAVRGLIEQARADHGALVNREAQVERELHDLDLVQQLAMASMRRAAEVEALDIHAMKAFTEAGAQRRKLLGLDEATKVEATVTTRDAVTEELNAMLARAGRDPIEARGE